MSFDIVDSNVAADKLTDAAKASGVGLIVRAITFEAESADDAGDIKALFRVGAHEIPLEGYVTSDAITGATEVDVGLYRDDETVVDIDALADSINIASGYSFGSEIDILSALGVHERGILTFYEIANDIKTTDVIGHLPNDSYWVCLTLVSEVTGSGTVTVVLKTLSR